MKNQTIRRLAIFAIAGSLVATATGCGNQAYVAGTTSAASTAPGSFIVQPKVDILLVQDDTGSSEPIFTNLSSQATAFLQTLQAQGWDYHFAAIPLTTRTTLTQVQASQYDPNWGSQWIAPYPGAIAANIETVSAGAFRTLSDYSGFLTGADTSTALNGAEPAFANLQYMMVDSTMTNTGFLRPDAQLAVIVIATADDTSGRNYCTGPYAPMGSLYGTGESCDLIPLAQNGSDPSLVCGTAGANPSPYCNNYTTSLTPYETFMKNFKGRNNTQLMHFYAAVSQNRVLGEGCMGANTFVGSRYEAMASAVGGQSFDICSQPISSVLAGVASNLQAEQINFLTDYLFMAQQPNPASIVVWRNPGGDTTQAVQIPEDPNNGWTYVGYVNNQYAINYPVNMDLASGWAIQLNGSGELAGGDTATIDFQPAGTQNAAGN